MECFVMNLNEIEGRIDPFYYSKLFVENERTIEESKYEIKTLKEISNIIVDGPFGSQLKVEEYTKNGIPLIRVKDVKNEKLIEENFVYITKEKQSELKRSKVNPNDILLTKAGSIGNACIFPEHLKEANITSHLAKIEVKDGINPKYICKYLNTKFGKLQIFRKGNKTTRPELNLEEVSTTKIILPNIETQNKIVLLMDNAYSSKKQKEYEAQQLLFSLNDYILDELDIKLPELKDRTTYVVNADELEHNRVDAYYYQPKFKKVEEAFQNGRYKLIHFHKIMKSITNGFDFREYSENGLNYLRVANIKPFQIIYEDLKKIELLRDDIKKEIKLKNRNILLTRKGTFGIAVCVKQDSDDIISSEIFNIELSTDDNSYYIVSILNSKIGQMQFDRNKIGAIMGSLTQDVIQSIKLPLPPHDIQNRIAEEVRSRIQKAEQMQKVANEELEKAKLEVERMILGENG